MKISIVMTAYNSEKYISEQIKTILDNSPEDAEIIICDDCSKDNTVNIIKSYNDDRILFFENEHNLGVNGNLEKCLTLVTGDIIVLSDSDNIWLEGKIDKVLPYFEKPNVGMVMHDAKIVNENLEPILDSYYAWRKSKPGLLRNIIKNGYGGSMIAFKSSLLKYILPFPKNLPFFFDEWIGMMCARHSKCIFIDEKLSLWRRHEGTVSSVGKVGNNNKKTKNKKHSFKISKYINIIIDRAKKLRFALSR